MPAQLFRTLAFHEHFRLVDWEVHPDCNELVRGGTSVRLEPKVMQLLTYLAEHPGKVLSRREILDRVWEGAFVVDEALTYAVTELRRALDDDSKNPRYIQTIPRRGYRLVAQVTRPSDGSAEPRRTFRRRLAWLVGPVGLAAVLAAAGTAYRWRSPAFPFLSGDRVLVARFENRTGEALFDQTFEYWLERELGNSRFVRIVPRERVEDTLRLMKRPANTVVDRALGREICLRDGDIRALVVGRAEKIGTQFVLSAELIEPIHGEAVASSAEEARGTGDVLPAMRRLSGWLCETLGEKLAEIRMREKLERVTTPSLHALQLFTQAERLVRLDKRDAAAELLKQCIAEDPDFASAHLFLAWALFRRSPEEYLSPVRRAVELAGSTSERERYFILGSYYSLLGKPEKAIAAYEALRVVDPDHYWGIGNLADAYGRTGRIGEATSCRITLADSRPNNVLAQYMAASAIVGTEGDPAKARPYIDRAVRVMTQDDERVWPWLPPFLQEFPARAAFARGDPCEALMEWQRRMQNPPPCTVYAIAGKLRAAEECVQRHADSFGMAMVSFLKNDGSAFRQRALRCRDTEGLVSSGSLVVLQARAGGLPEARKHLGVWKSTGFARSLSGGTASVLEGEIARASGDAENAIRLLLEGLAVPSFDGGIATYFLGAESLEELLRAQGRHQEALEVLVSASKLRISSAFRGFSFAFWMRNQQRLAALYRELGRVTDAERVEAELGRLLACADEDHPILLALQQTARKGSMTAAR